MWREVTSSDDETHEEVAFPKMQCFQCCSWSDLEALPCQNLIAAVAYILAVSIPALRQPLD